ncbi:MAG: cation transporter [Chloroflexi bacterium]|nr:cation transporter [Chloroflexota bacterium]
MSRTKVGAAKLSVISNSLLILIKLTAGVITGSISIVAEAIHSLFDLVAALIALVSVRVSGQPADKEHPFGHGKAESISGLIEAALIFVAVALIVQQAISRIIEGSSLKLTDVGIGVMLVSVIVNIAVSRRLTKVSRDTDSLALEADAAHLNTDAYTSLGVMLGLVAVRLTGLDILDSIMALGVAGLVVRAAYNISAKALRGLMDVRLPLEEESIIRSAIAEHFGEVVGFHALRTRKAGSQRQVDLHLVMSRDISLESAHAMCDHLEQDMLTKLRDVNVTIHVEPCASTECDRCAVACSLQKGSDHKSSAT